mmetsp:Transcript_9870/g.19724  ORF Transcript_9870/g.19724 Transcript_9870/m.19724 type:complete len:273 (-) Transcript_9870:397-1215(-)|eukprot:CAMPEP_0181323244 /NCGR_PEP_ID=MMETSP1101-20121128/19672_1 /TAXON_ID=46948 /ORGANISM="Rhodomonas abbreviata, Strain Caron Lab Isolate" /LENGTH=272 /DNA_ID=CAMNT_0023431239 /DNA_START=329 /DNA_END=1147 /DNA_ORIENTATION=+
MSSFGASRGLNLSISPPECNINFGYDSERGNVIGDIHRITHEHIDHETEEVVLSPRSESQLDKLLCSTVMRCLAGECFLQGRGLYLSCEVEEEEEEECKMTSEVDFAEPTAESADSADPAVSSLCGKRKRGFNVTTGPSPSEVGYDSGDDASPTSVVWHDWKKVEKDIHSTDEADGEEPVSQQPDISKNKLEGELDGAAPSVVGPGDVEMGREDGNQSKDVEWMSGLCANALRDREAAAPDTSQPEAEELGTDVDERSSSRLETEVRVACTV